LDFIGKDFQFLPIALKKVNDEADINRNFLPMLDERTESKGSIVLCRVENNRTVDSRQSNQVLNQAI